jgi:hypothetical protein
MSKNFAGRLGLISVIFLVTSVVLAVGLSSPAFASCGGNTVHDWIGGYDSSYSSYRGAKGDLYVNSFGSSHQYHVARNVVIWQNSNNFAEAGWVILESINQLMHPYKTWVNDGVVRTTYLSADFGGGTNHTFKVHDENGDRYWSFAYDGNAMGNEYANFPYGNAVSETERWCTSDSLWAHAYNLQNLTYINGSWANWAANSKWADTASDYDFCWMSKTEYYAKQTC